MTGKLAEFTARGDQVGGVHPHSWRWNAVARRWVSDEGDPEWVAHCARMGLNAYAEAFGRTCAAYRHGDRAMTTALAHLLDEADVKVDLTVEPGLPATRGLANGELTTGWIEDTTRAPTEAYRPSRNDFRVPAARQNGLLIVPLTRALDIQIIEQRGTVQPHGQWDTLILWDDPARFRSRLLRCLANPQLRHLAFAIRSELPLCESWSWFEANLAELCRHPINADLVWCTASEVAPLLPPPVEQKSSDVADPRRAGLWAGGATDAGFVDGAELDALEAMGRTAASCLDMTQDLSARIDATSTVHARELETIQATLDASDAALAQTRATASGIQASLRAAQSDRALLFAQLGEEQARHLGLESRLTEETEENRRLATSLETVTLELAALRGTTTWRIHDRLLPLLRTMSRLVSRRRGSRVPERPSTVDFT